MARHGVLIGAPILRVMGWMRVGLGPGLILSAYISAHQRQSPVCYVEGRLAMRGISIPPEAAIKIKKAYVR